MAARSRPDLAETYRQQLQERGFRSDPAQEAAVRGARRPAPAPAEEAALVARRGASQLLSKLGKRKPVKPEKGLYLWGGVGRGKTWLMDLFFQSLPFEAKRRRHFHRFMHDVHAQLKQLFESRVAAGDGRGDHRGGYARAVLRRVLRVRHCGRDDPRHVARRAVPARRGAGRHVERATEGSVQARPAARALPARHQAARRPTRVLAGRRRHGLPASPAHAGGHLHRFRRTRRPDGAPRGPVRRPVGQRPVRRRAPSKSKAARSRW